MYIVILLLLLSKLCASFSEEEYDEYMGMSHDRYCDIVEFDKKFYDRQILFGGYGRAFSLFMHELTGDLYFSRANRKEDLNDRLIIRCNSVQKYCTDVAGIDIAYAIAYDQNTDEIFFAGKDGIYRYDLFIHRAKRVAAPGIPIRHIFIYNEFFYYVASPTHRLYAFRNRQYDDVTLAIYTEVDRFHIANETHAYLSNKTGLFELSNKPQKVTALSKDIHVRQISQDSDNNVYFCASDGIYKYSSRLKRTMRIRVTSQIYGMTIVNILAPRDNLIIIYSDEKNIYRLIPTDSAYCIKKYKEKRKQYHDSHPKNSTIMHKHTEMNPPFVSP